MPWPGITMKDESIGAKFSLADFEPHGLAHQDVRLEAKVVLLHSTFASNAIAVGEP